MVRYTFEGELNRGFRAADSAKGHLVPVRFVIQIREVV